MANLHFASRTMLPVASARGAPQRIIVALAFESPLLAQQALLAALRLQEQRELTLHDAVFVGRCRYDAPEVIETMDPTPVAAAVPSSLLGALVGALVAGPIGFLIGGIVAGGTGALIAKMIDIGIPDAVIHQLRSLTKPGQTVLALLVSNWGPAAVVEQLQRFVGAHVVYAELPPASLEAVRHALREC